MEKNIGIIVISFIFLGLAGLGTVILVRWLLMMSRCIKSRSWPTVEGTINVSRIVSWQDSDSGGVAIGDIKYLGSIGYSYEINGLKHTSHRISFGDDFRRFGRKEKAEEMTAKYSPGGKVKVYYNPKRPQISTLETGFEPKFIIWLVMCIFSIGIGTYLFSVSVLSEILGN